MRNWLFVVVLFLPSFVFAQEFVSVVDSSLYPSVANLDFIPKSSNQAILKYVVRPNDYISPESVVLSVDIIPRLNKLPVIYSSSLGFLETDSSSDTRTFYSIIDGSNIFFRQSTSTFARLSPQIQNLLVSKGLGTVEQRSAYIASFKLSVGPLVDPSTILGDLQKLLGPWAAAAIGFMIALFGLDLGTRYMDRFAKQAAKEARAADRRERNKEIRYDPIAKQFRQHLSELAMVSRNTYGIYSRTEQREARKLFEQAASDYAIYKKNRGWYA